jgi:flagellar motor switch protein FliG
MEASNSRPSIERAAILLMTLGEEDAAAVLKQMSAKEVQRVGTAMAQLGGVSREDVSAVLGQFSPRISISRPRSASTLINMYARS